MPKSHPISNVNFFLCLNQKKKNLLTTKIICIIIFLCYSKFSILVHCPHFCAVCFSEKHFLMFGTTENFGQLRTCRLVNDKRFWTENAFYHP